MQTSVCIPGATYRLQFHADFTFAQAAEIGAYLRDLGVTHVYASPLFQAAPGSTHGYDACSASTVSEVLGGEAGLRKLSETLRSVGLRLLLDIVPNHMGANATNAWWWDVLKNGQRSSYATFFDIDWAAENAGGKVVLPVLGDRLGAVLERGEIRVVCSGQECLLTYFDHEYPVSPDTPREALIELSRRERQRPDELMPVLDAQHYRLTYWRNGPDEINYRRFFDVSGLVALRMERPEVFEATHEAVLAFTREGLIHGLRIDHPDGLLDPKQYLERLQSSSGPGGIYVVAEKILVGEERLARDWPIHGTTGYDFLIQLNGLFVASQQEGRFTELYHRFTGRTLPFSEVAYRSKKKILDLSFSGDVDKLARELKRLASRTIDGQDFTWRELRSAIVEVIACMQRYRTYVQNDSEKLSAADTEALARAVSEAQQRCPASADAIAYLSSVLALRAPFTENDAVAARAFVLRVQQLSGPAAAKGIEDTAFYNYHRLVSLNEVGGEPSEFGTSPAEFHHWNRERATGWPHSLSATATHDTKRGEDVRARIHVLSEMPDAWEAAATRWAELNQKHKKQVAGSSAPDRNDEYLLYQTLVGVWQDGVPLEQLRDRVRDYLLKAAREAKDHTSWTESNAAYETALTEFVSALLGSADGEFVRDLRAFANRVAWFGRFNSLAQTLLKLSCPGVPDIYQGCELFDFSLVDPDNRRPVDYQKRRAMLERLRETESQAAVMRGIVGDEEGMAKLFLIWRMLELRKSQRMLFERGEYLPLDVHGAGKEHLFAFARVQDGAAALFAAPRLVYILLKGEAREPFGREVWGDTTVELPPSLAGRTFRNVLTHEERRATGGRLAVGELFASFPVAALVAA